MKWPPTLCWTAPKTINGNRHFQVKTYGGKNEDRWVDIFPTKNKKDITKSIRVSIGTKEQMIFFWDNYKVLDLIN